MNRLPLLPLEEEGRLNDMPLRENFIERVFAYYRWTEMLDKEPTPGGLVKFHTAHKLTLMAHSPAHYTEMGRLENEAMDFYDEMRSRIALDRLGEAEDIAHTALFLLSDKASYITGCDILVDGGFVARVAKEQRQQAVSNLG